ncbi:MAG: hypothetical protein KC777_20490 [Cyanobacteria bacterium HKST-UBA02]|nr:hypothetical protein [Cyanobacteria bacterium HKST-UBA02]
MTRLLNDHKSASLTLFGSSIKTAIGEFSFEGMLSMVREKLSASLSQVALITTILSVTAGFAQGTLIAHQIDMELIKADLLGTQYYTNRPARAGRANLRAHRSGTTSIH